MTINTTTQRRPSAGRARLPILIAALMLVISMAFIGSGMAGSAQAQGASNAIPSINLDSNEPGQLTITWQAPERAPTDYRLMWANTNLGFPSYKNPNEAERANEYPLGDVTALTLSNLTPGDSYKVKIRSRYYNADGSVRESSGPWTSTATQRVKDYPPAAPTGLAASQVSHDSLTLTWDDPQDANITGYRVMRGPDAGSLSTLANTQSNSTSFADSTVDPETTYHYGVLALSQDGDGAQSTTSVTTPAEPQPDPPAAPTGLTASNVQHDSLTLKWDDPEDDSITGYRVLRGPDTDNLSTIEEDTEGTSTEYEDETVSPETTYHYAVQALSQDGNSVQSNAISATTPAASSSGEQDAPRETPKKEDPPQRTGAKQAVTTFISNTGQSSSNASTSVRATAFTTGTDTYTLSSVGIHHGLQGAITPQVQIYNHASGNPGTVVATMSNPGSITAGVNIYPAPANTTLSASTTYWVVTSNSAATNGQGFRVGTISGTNLDSGTAEGWTIGNARYKDDIDNSSWSSGTLERLRFQIRGTGTTTTNTAPTVANAIPDQSATVGTDFSYTFPPNTFNDADTGDILTYSANKADDSALPTWLTFTDTTRTFSGTPTAPETVSVKVTANDSTASVSDEFDITVQFTAFISNAGQSSSNASAQVRATEFTTGTDTYTLSSVGIHHGLQSSVTPQVQIYSDASGKPGTVVATMSNPGSITAGVNVYTAPANTTLSASTTYWVVTSNSAATDGQGFRVNTTPTNNLDSGTAAGWNIGNARFKTDINATSWSAIIGARLRFQIRGTSTALTVANAIPDQSATANTAFRYMFPTNTFNATNTLTYTATKDDGALLPTWLTFTDTTHTFSGTPTAAATVSVKVTANDGTASVSDEFDIVVKAAASATTEVPYNWALNPTDLTTGKRFRLVFLSSTKRDASSTDIATYNTFILGLAAAGHADIHTYSAGFRAVGCTAAVDARDNTGTTSTGTDVSIYWLNGAKVADSYADFYDGSWDDEANDKNESGTNGLDTSNAFNYPLTGCAHNGTEAFVTSVSRALGATDVRLGRPNSSTTGHGPLSSVTEGENNSSRPMYGISGVYRIGAAADTTPPTVTTAQTSATGGQVQLRFSENPRTSNLPPTSAFEVTTDGEPHATSGSVAVSMNLVFFAVSPNISQGQAVVVTYTDPTGGNDANAIQDAAGNDVATFTTGVNSVPAVNNRSTTAATAPGAPTSLTATASGITQINLSWTAPADNGGRNITGYKIEVSSDSGNAWTDHVATTGDNNTTYAHTGLAVSTTRHYRVSAINSIGTSSASNVDNATTVYRDVKVQFGANLYRVTEGSTVNVNVRLDVDPERTVIIPITKTHLGSVGGSDYSGVPATVTFNAGETSKDILFMAVDDDEVDAANERVQLGISTTLPSKVTRGARFTVLVEIEDNDEMGTMGTNAPPTATNGDVTVDEDKIFYFWFRPSILGYSDTDGNSMASFTITEMPDRGALTMSGWPINNLPFRIHSKSVDNQGRSLRYKPAPNGHGTPYATFKFKVNDGTVDSTAEYTMTINITPVNDPAYGRVFITGPTQAGYELTAFTSAIGDRDGIPRDQLNYQWKRYAADGTTFETNIGANSSTYRVTDNDVGKKIRLEVRFTDNDGTDEGPLTSPAFPYIATQTVGEATFISTIGMVGDSYRSFTTQEQGQVFTTGGNPNGYTVTSVVIISEDSASDDVALKICGVDESLHPTAVCTDLTAPGTYPAGPLVFTAPPGTMLAGGRTNYMVVFDSPGDDNVRLDTHYSDGYDSNSLVGFSIRNRIHYKTGTGWQEISYRRGFRIAVLGTINP